MINKENKAAFMAVASALVSAAAGGFICVCYIANQFGGIEVFTKQFENLRTLSNVVQVAEGTYYREVDQDKIFVGAAKGAMRSLDDRYAAFYTKAEYAELNQKQEGRYEGLGIVLSQKPPVTYISKVYESSPAHDAGILAGDRIDKVNEHVIYDVPIEHVLALINELKGEEITLGISRGDEQLSIAIRFGQIVADRVFYHKIDDVGYIDIDEFTGNCVEGFDKAISRAREDKVTGLVIDIRNNPGGNLEKVVAIADWLLGDTAIITMKTRYGEEEAYSSDAYKIELPYVVLVNGDSASASEVLAGAVQDCKSGLIIGEKTFGKGIVQTTFELEEDRGFVKLTTQEYFTPSGRSIHEIGIDPDVVVELREGDMMSDGGNVNPDKDAQLMVALEMLKKK